MTEFREHMAQRPSWDCGTCGKDWPCPPAREQMAAELDRTQVRIFMWLQLEQAVGELPSTPAAEVFDRFLGWTR